MADSSRPEFWTTRYHSGQTPWDLGRAPLALLDWLSRNPGGSRVLIPGVGSGHELPEFRRAGWEITAIDLSQAAIDRARARLGGDETGVMLIPGDFFSAHLPFGSFDLLYERTFLCALHPARWRRAVARMASLLKPQGLIAGHYYFGDKTDGPPFGLGQGEDDTLFDMRFAKLEDAPATDSLPVFQGRERWQVRRRKD